MKSITKIIFIIIAFTIILPDIKAQTTEQMRIWAFNGVAVNFTVPTVTQQIISTPIAGANGAYASYYDENDQLVVRVVDNTVYDEENNPVDQLFDQPASNFTIVNQMVIFPQSLSNNCEFNIYYIVISNGNQVNVRYATYSKYLKQIVEEHEIWSYSYQVGSRADWNFAISDFIDDTDEQRMYVVLSSHSTSKSNDTLKIAYFRGPTFRLESIDLFGNGITANAIGEVELASDLSFLTFTTPYNTTADLHVYPINVNTGMFSGTFTHLNVSTGSSMFVGLEISHDNDYLYTSNLNDKIYRINVTNPSLPYINGYFLPQSGQLSYTSSRIERAHNGYYYMVNSNGELGYFTSNFNGISYQTNIGVNAVINNSLHANEPDFSFNMYVIPGQVDGCQYNYTTGSEISCCESYNESVVIDPGSEVSVQGDDIVVTGSNVVWNTSLNPFNQSTDIYMKGDLIIQPGAKLTITGLTLHFKENQKVQLNQNAAGGITVSFKSEIE